MSLKIFSSAHTDCIALLISCHALCFTGPVTPLLKLGNRIFFLKETSCSYLCRRIFFFLFGDSGIFLSFCLSLMLPVKLQWFIGL